jgi:hypothetical protein
MSRASAAADDPRVPPSFGQIWRVLARAVWPFRAVVQIYMLLS